MRDWGYIDTEDDIYSDEGPEIEILDPIDVSVGQEGQESPVSQIDS